jgi:hypothetical protein
MLWHNASKHLGQGLQEKLMERLHTNHLRELIHRLQGGESELCIVQDEKK